MNVKSLVSKGCPPFVRRLFDEIEKSPIGFRLAQGVFWTMAGTVISRGMMFCATVLVARTLGKTVFGELGMIRSTVGMFGLFAGFGLGLTATKHVAELRQGDPARAIRIIWLSRLVAIGTGGLLAMILFIFAPWLAEHTINAPHLAGVLRISALILFINALNGAQTGALAGFEAFKDIAYINFFVGLFSFPIIICGAYFGGLTGTVWALAINLCFNWMLNNVALRKEIRRYSVPFSFRGWGREWPILLKFSLPVVLASIIASPAKWAGRVLLTNQPNGYNEMGILTAALSFQMILMFVSGMLNVPLLSIISHAGLKISNKLRTANILSSWILGVIVAIPLLCFPEIAQMIFGNEYDTYSFKATFSLVVFYTSIMTFKSGLTRSMVANNILWWGVFSNSLWAFIMIVSAFFFVRWGALGLALSFTIAYILQTVVVLPICYSRKLIPKWTFFSLKSALIWFVIVALVLLNIANISLIFRSIAFVPSILLVGFSFIRISKGVAGKRNLDNG